MGFGGAAVVHRSMRLLEDHRALDRAEVKSTRRDGKIQFPYFFRFLVTCFTTTQSPKPS